MLGPEDIKFISSLLLSLQPDIKELIIIKKIDVICTDAILSLRNIFDILCIMYILNGKRTESHRT